MSTATDTVDFTAEWRAWHEAHETQRADPHGFLAITSLNWLDETPTRYPDAPGEWSTSTTGPAVTLSDGEQIVVDGQTITGSTEPVTYEFGVIPERGGITANTGTDGDAR